MGLFDNIYGFNPNAIQAPSYPQTRISTTPNPPLINPVASSTELPMVNGYESAMRYPMPPNSRIALFDEYYQKITESYKEVPKYIQETRSEIIDMYTEKTAKVKLMHDMFNQ